MLYIFLYSRGCSYEPAIFSLSPRSHKPVFGLFSGVTEDFTEVQFEVSNHIQYVSKAVSGAILNATHRSIFAPVFDFETFPNLFFQNSNFKQQDSIPFDSSICNRTSGKQPTMSLTYSA